MNEPALIATFVAIITLCGFALTMFKFVQATGDKAIATTMAELKVAKSELSTDIDRVYLFESKVRTDKDAELHIFQDRVERRIELLEGGTVRKAELQMVETRITNQITKVEDKVDRLTEVLSEIGTLRHQINSIEKAVTTMNSRSN